MIKQATILLFITILFTGCLEKGHILKPTKEQRTENTTLNEEVKKQTSVLTKKIIKKKKTTITKKELVQKELSKETTSVSKVIIKQKTEKVETGFFSSLSDETKNNISGFVIMLIGIIILL